MLWWLHAGEQTLPVLAPLSFGTPRYSLVNSLPYPDCEIVFAVIGDYGLAGKDEADVAALIKSWQPDFIITTGDNNYPNGEAGTIDANIGQYFHEYIKPYHGDYGVGSLDVNRFYPLLGNHDWHTRDARPYLEYFTLPGNERYYDFEWGPVHFFAIDSSSTEPDGISPSSRQAMWLKEKLTASTASWRVVYLHHPPYSSGSNHGSIEPLRWPFAEWGAALVLAGHDHVYERLAVDGLVYVINGLGGNERYGFGTYLPESIVRYRDDFGALRVTATPREMIFEFITRAGEVVDEYTLQNETPNERCVLP